MSFREAMPPPRTTHQGLPLDPLGDFRSPDPLCPSPPNPGYATDSTVPWCQVDLQRVKNLIFEVLFGNKNYYNW